MRENTLETIFRWVSLCEHGFACKNCCWLWKGQTSSKGYGKVSYKGEKHIAHNLIYRLYHGIYDEGRVLICHNCDTPLCCNWHHLYKGSRASNMQDMVDRNRQSKGTQQPQAVLNDAKVLQMRRNYFSGGWRYLDLAYYFDVSMPVVQNALTAAKWRHVKGELLHIHKPTSIAS